MKDHVSILVCGDDGVGKSTFIGTLIARNFAHEVPAVMSDVHIPPEENDDQVYCTITDSSALPRDRQQLVEKMQSAESILVLYDVQRPETLTHLDTFWLPLIEANAEDVPVVIVRNKMDTLVAEGDLGEQRSVDLERQMEPLEKRYRCFHVSLECSSVSGMGINQAFYHGRTAALYPRAPLYNAEEGRLCPRFDRAMRRLFRIYDVDRDGLLCDDELNAFQFHAFRLLLSDSDLESLRKILGRLASERGENVEKFVQEEEGDDPGRFTEEGFLRLIQLFIDKKQMKAPWQAMSSHHYDEELVLVVPSEMTNPPPGKANAQDQVLSPKAHKFLLELFKQFSEEREGGGGLDASPPRLLTEGGQAEVFSVIPDPTCAPWDPPRSRGEDESSEEEGQGQEEGGGGGGGVFFMPPFARLGRAPGAGRAFTAEGWIAHWQMLALHSPALLRSYLFYVGFGGHAEEMLVDKRSQLSYRAAATTETSPRRSGARGRQPSVMEVFVLGSRGCGKSRLIKGLRLGDDLRSNQQPSSRGNVPRASGTASGGQPSEQGPSELAVGLDTKEGEEASPEDEALLEPGEGSAAGGGGGGVSGGEEDWEMVAEAEVPETCCGFAVLAEAAGSPSAAGFSGSSSSSSSSSYGSSLSVAVTEVPESYTDTFLEDQAWRCDLALLVFDPSSRESVDFITPLLADIPQGVPRLLVSCESSRGVNPSVVRIAQQKCKELELSPVVAVNPCTGLGLEGDRQLRQKITGPVCKGMLPFEERHRKADRNRKIYIAVAALAVAAGLVYAVASSTEQSASAAANLTDAGGSGSRGAGWEAGVGGALRAPMRAAKRAAAAAADYWRRWRSGGSGGGGEVLGGYVGAVGGSSI